MVDCNVPVERFCLILADIMNVSRIDGDEDLLDLGIDSASAIQFLEILNEEIDGEVLITALFEYPTVNSLFAHATEEAQKRTS